MIDLEKFQTLWNILAPLNRTFGKHNITIEIWAGSESGRLNIQLNWKTFIGEAEFNNLDEAIAKANEIIKTIILD
ncbi:hypothetical protein [Trichormus variabilis]|uniref:Uncharacterized protein n=1 Tax=Trichormus variabilis SAG 1403-4b TaxID=447716 RepID=A0A3S1I6N1_ANAVA|nr:hypothetical protein [Trichormus variabilis]MBD2629647.1 hypothetical protein [Trichormus variabilis FACHB-164]RUS92936.1 hypothetical protein DSM107003_46830 [Trichormus variabilis SAG 1403-4b]